MTHRFLRRAASPMTGVTESIGAIFGRATRSRSSARRASPTASATLAVLLIAFAGACGGSDGQSAEVAELSPMSGSTVEGQATASSRNGEVRVSLAVTGLAGPTTLRLSVMPGECPEDSWGAEGEGELPDAMSDPAEGALARLQITTEGTSGAGTLTFPAADLPPGGDIAIVVRDFPGTPLACGEVGGLPVTELPEGAPAPDADDAPAVPDTGGEDARDLDTGVSA